MILVACPVRFCFVQRVGTSSLRRVADSRSIEDPSAEAPEQKIEGLAAQPLLSLLRPPNRPVKALRFPVPPRGTTAVKLLRHLNGAVKFLTFPNQPGGVTAVRLVPPSKRNR